MDTIKLTIPLDRKLVSQWPVYKEKGCDLLMDHSIRGEIMVLVVTWMALHKDGYRMIRTPKVKDDGHQVKRVTMNRKDDLFIQLVLVNGLGVLIELINATHDLGFTPLYELCCKTMANQIKLQSVRQVQRKLKQTGGPTLTSERIKGVLMYLTVEKRFQLDTIELPEWQAALASLWSEQKVLYFVKQGAKIDTMANPCASHQDQSDKNELNLVEYCEQDLVDNLRQIRQSSKRLLPTKFLGILGKCTNLQVLVWDEEFGQMAGTKLTSVLDNLSVDHIEGSVQVSFAFTMNVGQTIARFPGSFMDVFELPSCNLVKFVDPVKELLVPLVQVLTEDCPWEYVINKIWWDEFVKYMGSEGHGMPGRMYTDPIKHGQTVSKDKWCREEKPSVNLVAVSSQIWRKLYNVFGVA